MKIVERDSGYRALSRGVHLLVFTFASSRRMLFLMGTATFGNKITSKIIPSGTPVRAGVSLRRCIPQI